MLLICTIQTTPTPKSLPNPMTSSQTLHKAPAARLATVPNPCIHSKNLNRSDKVRLTFDTLVIALFLPLFF